jgi:hypothetical protein
LHKSKIVVSLPYQFKTITMLTDSNNKSIYLHFFYYGVVVLLCYNGSEVTFKEFNGTNKANFNTEVAQLLNDNVAVFSSRQEKNYKI